MAKVTRAPKKQNKINVESLSERDMDILTMDTKEVMKKYKAEKQAVYDRRFALNKKIKEAGLTLDQLQGNTSKPEPAPEKAEPKAAAKTAKPKKENTPAEKQSEGREVMVVNKQVPVVMKPIEIAFENFSVKLNGVPKKISVNPDTNFIEIDL